MKNIIILVIITIGLFIIFCLSACSSTSPTLGTMTIPADSTNSVGEVNFISINRSLCYDSNTKVVYIRNYVYNGSYTYSAYLTTTGVPYHYDPETNQLIR